MKAGSSNLTLSAPLVLCLTPVVLAAPPTSETNARLRKALEQYPEADADGDGVLSLDEALAYREKMQARRSRPGGKEGGGPRIKPTHADVRYGPHDRNTLDLWLVESDEPAPLLICIHGGGFKGGDKRKYHTSVRLITDMHRAGISVAAINYRLTDGGKNPYPIPMLDGARAIQYLRHHAEQYRLDKTRFAATGGSAGGCMLLWLGLHDDLADPDSHDPVLRQSSRLQALAPNGGQSCLHLPTLLEWFQVESLVEHGGGRPLFGLPAEGEMDWTPELDKKAREASPITHLTKDDPPCYMSYGANKPVTEKSPAGLWVHHPIMGLKLKEAMDNLGLECHVQYQGGPPVEGYASQVDFIIQKLARPE